MENTEYMENGFKRDWLALTYLMNDELREQVHAELAPCTEIEFINRYLELDPDFESVIYSEFSTEFQEALGLL